MKNNKLWANKIDSIEIYNMTSHCKAKKKKSFVSDPSRASPQGGQNKNVGRASMLIV